MLLGIQVYKAIILVEANEYVYSLFPTRLLQYAVEENKESMIVDLYNCGLDVLWVIEMVFKELKTVMPRVIM